MCFDLLCLCSFVVFSVVLPCCVCGVVFCGVLCVISWFVLLSCVDIVWCVPVLFLAVVAFVVFVFVCLLCVFVLSCCVLLVCVVIGVVCV